MLRKKLYEIADIRAGGTPSRNNPDYWNGNIPWVKISNINGKYVTTYDETITELGLKNSSAKLFEKETILYTIFATLGRVGILQFDATTNQAIAGIKIKDNSISTDYLYYYLRSLESYVKDIGNGAAQQNINQTILKNFIVPVISKEKQSQICSELENIENVLLKKQHNLASLDELIKSRFIEMFGHYFEDVRYFVKVGDIATATIGLTYKPDNVTDEGIIVLRSGNIQNAELCLSDDIVRVSNIRIKEDKFVRENDILMCSRNGSARLVGKCCLIPKLNEQMSYGAFMTIIRSKYPYFLNGFFNSTYFLQQLTGTQTASVNQITTGMLNSYTVIKPSDTEENEFAEFVKLIDKSKFIVQKEIKDLQELLDKKMDEYFGQ